MTEQVFIFFIHPSLVLISIKVKVFFMQSNRIIKPLYSIPFLLLFLLFTPLRAQSIMECKAVIPASEPLMDINCSDEFTGKFGVALVIHFLRENDGSGGVPIGELPFMLEDIAAAFEEHDIFFKVKCVNEIKNSSLLNASAGTILDLASVYEDDSAINLFMWQPGAGGLANIGGRLAVSGYNSGNSTTTNVVNRTPIVHELGHTLGLHHTFAGTATPHGTDDNQGGSANPPELVDGSNCCDAGDFVCDTPADPNINVIMSQFGGTGAQVDCGWITPPVTDANGESYPNPFSSGRVNFMSYYNFFCDAPFFTEGQGNRMRGFLTNRDALQPVRRDEFIISETVTWETDMSADVDITILPGGRLNLQNATLEMGPGKKIEVRETAVLKVKNATVTLGAPYANDCVSGNFWQGIELHGGATNDGFPSIANIYNSTIELAENAVYLAPSTSFLPLRAHGRLYTAHTDYINTRTALTLFFDSPSNSIDDLSFKYRVIRCNFIINEDFPSPLNSFLYHAALINVRHSLFDGCTFSTPSLDEYNQSSGIFAFRSSPTIKSYCGFGYPDDDCPEAQYVQSTFSGFEKGVNLLSADGSEVIEAAFSNCLHGVYADNSNNLNIRDNSFTVANINNPQRSGASLFDCTGYTIDGNHFTVDNPDNLNLTSSGLYIFRSGTEYNDVTNNTFTGLRRGIYVSGRNRNTTAPTIGLGLFCNNHDNAGAGSQTASGPFDVYTDFGTTMASLQGSSNQPAGNLFSDNAATPGADFYYFNFNFFAFRIALEIIALIGMLRVITIAMMAIIDPIFL